MTLPSPFENEQRRERRVPAAVPIRFEWLTSDGEILRARGATRDISQSGLYSYMEHPLIVGLEVLFDLRFPAELTGNESLIFHCHGHVLRCERLAKRFGAAVSVESHQPIHTTREYLRSSTRVFPQSPVVAAYAGLRSLVLNLSRSGALVDDLHPAPVGQKIELRLQSAEWNREIVVQAVVRRVEPDVGMGVEFVALTSEADRQLQAFVETNAALD